MLKQINIKKFIPIDKIEEIDFSGKVYALKIKNDPSYCLSNGILSANCDLPDIDIDFEDRKREQVRQYLEDTYGKDNVSGISTFLQMKGRATVRDVARVFDIPLKEADMFAKAIEYGEDKSAIQKAIKETQEGHDFESKYPDETKVMLKLEGTVKSCVSGNSRVLVLKERFPLRAKAATIKSLFDKNFRGKIRSYNFEKGHFFFDKIKDIYFAGIKEVIKIEVGMSTSLTLTSDHRVLSKRGWVKAEELKVGELVATNGRKGQIAWNKGLKGVCAAWNKGLKGVQVAWNKGLSKKDHFFIRQASERWKKNNPLKKIENKIKVAKRSFKHGLYSKKTREIIKNNLYCQCCKKNKSQEIHHLDKNRYNNKVHNLIAVCVKCHNKYHPKPNPPKLNEFLTIKYRRITKIEKKGQEETYDICMRSRHQNYVCNKIITHNSGQHAAAVVISSENLKLGTKGNLCRRGKDIVVSNWDMEDAEYMGLMKLDILGLSALSILSETKKLILENHKEEIVFEQIPAEDRKVLNTLSKGNTVGIFQLSTSLSTDMCKEVGVDVFEDIVSVLAIARPGSLHSGTTKDFINRKQGRRWEKIHPTYDEITKSTYGVLIFQEQVMEVFHKVAGLPYGVADNIRKIIGKKRDVKEFEKYKQQFSDGCAKLKTFNTREVEWFWEMLLKCANYLFNRCLSKNETIYRSKGNNKYNKLNIEEMYKIKNDREYAIKTGHRSLHDKYRTFGYGSALSLCKDKKLRKNAIVDIYYSGKMPVYKIILKGGKTLICTLNHSVPTPQGMKKVSELKIGDLLFTKGKYEKTNHNQKFNFYKKGEYKGNFPTRGQEGFQKIKNGRSVLFQQFKKKCRKQKKPCDLCQKRYNKKLRFEVHHIDFYRINNDVSNLQFLCPSCHKKIHYQNGRLKQYEKGLLVKERKIISIDYIGEEDCYDVEMNSPNHNFLTGNGIIVSNSHAVSYGILSQWTAYCKYYYPTEFICASLTYGAEEKKVELIEEAKRLGLKIIPPKIGLSDSLKWKTGDRCLYVPFIEIKGFGESTAEKCLTKIKNKQLGFFNLFAERENEVQGKTKVDRILNEIKAFDKEDMPSIEKINKYLTFNI